MIQKLFKYPKINITVILIVTIFFGRFLKDVSINNELEIMIPSTAPEKIALDSLKREFGESEVIAIALYSETESVLRPEVLSWIDSLTTHLQELPEIDDVMSLTDVDHITGNDEGMVIGSLWNSEENTWADMGTIRNKLWDWQEMYRGTFVSSNLYVTQMVVVLEDEIPIEEQEKVLNQIKLFIEENKPPVDEIHIAGFTAVTVTMRETISRDLGTLIPIVAVVLALVLLISFRSFSGVFLPLITVALATITTVGLVGLLGIQLNILTSNVPVVLLATGSAYGIHLLSRYYMLRQRITGELNKDDHFELVMEVVRSTGMAVILAALTTMAGFFAMAITDFIPMREMGVIMTLGVLFSLVTAIVLIPSLLLVMPKPIKLPHRNNQIDDQSGIDRVLERFANLSLNHPKGILVFFIIMSLVMIVGAARVKIDSRLITNLPKDSDMRIADTFQNAHMAGTGSLNIVIRGEYPGSLTEPAILKVMDDLDDYLRNEVEAVQNVAGFHDMVKRMNQVMHVDAPSPYLVAEPHIDSEAGNKSAEPEMEFIAEESDFSFEEESSFSFEEESEFSYEEASATVEVEPAVEQKQGAVNASLYGAFMAVMADRSTLPAENQEWIELFMALENLGGEAFNEIPVDPEKYGGADLSNLISQYLLLYSGNLDNYLDDGLEPKVARIIINYNKDDLKTIQTIARTSGRFLDEHLPEGYTHEIAGNGLLSQAMHRFIIKSNALSIPLALLFVIIIMAFSNGSLKVGVLGGIPLVTTLLVIFGVMGWANLSLSMGTTIIFAITIGIGVDYSIHFITRYRHEREAGKAQPEAILNTTHIAGRAIIYNAISVGLGFAVMLFSKMMPLRSVGLLVLITMIVSALTSLTLLPALLHWIRPVFSKIESKN